MLISSRPITIRAIEQSIPKNFTVFSAAGDQTSKPLEEAKHGMFSYFLMKGMEGDADANNDNKITVRELHMLNRMLYNNHQALKPLNYKVIKTGCLYNLTRDVKMILSSVYHSFKS